MEAYSQVHAPQELTKDQVWEEEEYITEIGVNFGGQKAVNDVNARVAQQKQSNSRLDAARSQRFGGTNPVVKAAKGGVQGTLDKTSGKWTPTKTSPTKPATPKPTTTAPKPTTTAPKPTTPAAKPATTAPKPASPAKPAGSAMDQWAKANPKLAAAKAERDRTRGTSATTNPLMKDTKSSLPAPKAPTPSTAKTGFDLAKKGTNLAAGVDLFDIVKGYLLDEGYAESEEGAMVIMVNMSEEWRKSILESHGVEIYAQELELDEASVTDERVRRNQKAFGSNYTPPRDWDASANRGKGAVLNDKQKEKQRRKGLRQEELELDENRAMSRDPEGSKSGYSKQPDPSKEGFTGIGNMSIKQIMSMNKKIADKKKVTKEDLESWVAESQYARENPEKYERSPEAREGRRKRSGINDPKTGINSPAFAAFMAQQMGGKKKKG
jgi:hypothetical protein